MDTNQELIDALSTLDSLERLQADRRRLSGISYYVPNPIQFKCHQSKARIILYSGGNRAGKSTLGAVELAWHVTKRYPDYFPKERRFKGPIKAVVVCDANQKIEKVIEPKINEYLPKDCIKSRKTVGGYLNRIICKDGSTIDFLSSEQDDMAFEGADWHFYWGDEPQKKKKFDAIMRGLIDHGGSCILTFTPLVEPWMKEELIDKADGRKIDAFIADTYDNQFDIKGNQILKRENIDEMASMWDEDVRDTRIHGKFFHLRGVVYPEFGEIHQIEFGYEYPDPVISVLDPHDRQPHHVIWAVLDRNDDLFVHSELSIHCTVSELAKLIKKVEKDNGYKMKRRLIDPNFGRKPLITTGRNMIQELGINGCPGWYEADDAKEEGRLKVKEYLHYDKTRAIDFTNKPKIFFHKGRVPKTIHSVKNHQYEEWVGKIAGERDPKEKPKDKDTHGADCIRYLCMSNPRFQRMREELYELEEAPY